MTRDILAEYFLATIWSWRRAKLRNALPLVLASSVLGCGSDGSEPDPDPPTMDADGSSPLNGGDTGVDGDVAGDGDAGDGDTVGGDGDLVGDGGVGDGDGDSGLSNEDASSGDDDGGAIDSDAGDAGPSSANRLFLTKTAYTGDLGGLAGADEKCQTSAAAAGLEGTFIALLGTSTVNAEDRLGEARGFVRVDGEPLADFSSQLVFGTVWNAPIVNEYLELMPPETLAATGFARLGQADNVCDDWTNAEEQGDFGIAGDGGGRWRYVGVGGCEKRLHLYCTEVSHQVEVEPRATSGVRTAFVAAGFDPSSGLAGADALCMAEASDANLSGTFKALLATSSEAPIARFDLAGAPWARVDGTLLVNAAEDLTDARLLAPLNQQADGSYLAEGWVWTGTNDPNRVAIESCGDWSENEAPFAGHIGRVTATGSAFLSDGVYSSPWPCQNENALVYCFEEDGDGAAPAAPTDSEANVVFVTADTWNGNLGGLAGADAKCQTAATTAGLSGTFIALLSTASMSAEQRLAGARGFVRTDGQPVADTARDLVSGRFIYPVSFTESEVYLNDGAWSGFDSDCQGWTSNSATAAGSAGRSGDGGLSAFANGASSCDLEHHLYCAQTAYDGVIPELGTAGTRLAFLARGNLVPSDQYYAVDPSVGLTGLDDLCQDEADAFGLTGTFAAFVATSTASAASRFDENGDPWARVDGALLAETAQDFLSDGPVIPLNLAADGHEYFSNTVAWFGASGPSELASNNCSDWSSNASNVTGSIVSVERPGSFNGGSAYAWNFEFLHLFCLEQ